MGILRTDIKQALPWTSDLGNSTCPHFDWFVPPVASLYFGSAIPPSRMNLICSKKWKYCGFQTFVLLPGCWKSDLCCLIVVWHFPILTFLLSVHLVLILIQHWLSSKKVAKDLLVIWELFMQDVMGPGKSRSSVEKRWAVVWSTRTLGGTYFSLHYEGAIEKESVLIRQHWAWKGTAASN